MLINSLVFPSMARAPDEITEDQWAVLRTL